MKITRLELPLGDSNLILETGKLAKQAHGAVVVGMGETLLLATACEGGAIPGRDFFPLTVDYREKTYAAGKFPGGYIKRETRPSLKETLTSRLTDRPIRPLFPVNYINEVQVLITTLSADKANDLPPALPRANRCGAHRAGEWQACLHAHLPAAGRERPRSRGGWYQRRHHHD